MGFAVYRFPVGGGVGGQKLLAKMCGSGVFCEGVCRERWCETACGGGNDDVNVCLKCTASRSMLISVVAGLGLLRVFPLPVLVAPPRIVGVSFLLLGLSFVCFGQN